MNMGYLGFVMSVCIGISYMAVTCYNLGSKKIKKIIETAAIIAVAYTLIWGAWNGWEFITSF